MDKLTGKMRWLPGFFGALKPQVEVLTRDRSLRAPGPPGTPPRLAKDWVDFRPHHLLQLSGIIDEQARYIEELEAELRPRRAAEQAGDFGCQNFYPALGEKPGL
ncbi:hypothetical protein D3C85_704930 [compost metagenome]